MPRSSTNLIRAALLHVAVFAAILAASEIGFQTGSVAGHAAGTSSVGARTPLLWLPPAIALAASILGGLRMAPTIIVSAAVSFLIARCFGVAAIPMAFGAGLAPGLVAWGLRTSGRFDPRLSRPADLGRLLAIAIPCAAGLDLLVTVLALRWIEGWTMDWLSIWSIWSSASVVCSALLVPPILLFAAHRPSMPRMGRVLEFAGLTAGLAGCAWLGLVHPTELGVLEPAGSFLPVPLAMLLAVRFDRVGAAVGALVIGGTALGGAAIGVGIYAPDSAVGADSLHAVLNLWSLVLGLGSTTLLVGVTVAAQRRREAEVLTVAERWRRVVDAAHLGSWLLDNEWRTVEANPRLAAMLGTTAEGLRGRSILDFVAEPARERARRMLLEARSSGAEVELECQRRDGRTAWLGLHLSRSLGDDGGGVLAAVEDLAERRRAEAEWLRLESNMLHAQKLESLGVLAGGIAHDFNNIVMGIRGNAGLLRVREPSVDNARESAHRIDALCERAAELVSTLLAYAGKATFTPERVDLVRAIRESISVARLAAPLAARIEFEVPTAPLVLEADPLQLRQLLVAILTNGTEALGTSGGTVRVRTRLAGSPAGSGVEIEVTDDGCGMDANTMRRIFEPFFSTKGVGRGLGMSAALGIARRAGGDVTVQSELGHGTQVAVRLPLAARAAEPPRPGRPAIDRRPTALLWEPDEGLRRLVAAGLEVRGYAITEISSFAALLEAARTRPPSLIVAASGDSSLEAIEAVRRLRERGCRSAIVLTNDDRERVVLHPQDARTLWLARPFELRGLLDAIDRAAEAAVPV